MSSTLRQCAAVTLLNIKSIPQRIAMSLTTMLAVGVAVAVLLGFLAISQGFRRTIEGGGSEGVAIVMRAGAESELNSVLTNEQVRLIDTAPGIAVVNGKPLTSAELNLVVDGIKRSSGTKANISLRGVGPEAMQVRPTIRIIKGRMFTPGTNEIVVGQGLLREFAGFEYGRTLRLGGNVWQVVGVFEAPGTAFESELWADMRVVQSQFHRGGYVQTVRAMLSSPAAFKRFETFVETDPRLKLEAKTEKEFLSTQAGFIADAIGGLGISLATIMAIGAVAGALNTMYSSVASRAGEIATLRIIGFSGFAALAGTMAEALALALLGGLLGAAAYFLAFNGMTTSLLAGSFTQVVFKLDASPALIGAAIAMAFLIGLFGGILPGLRAARQKAQLGLVEQ